MKVLITGAAGLLGRSLRRCQPVDHQVVATWRVSPLDLGVGPTHGRVVVQQVDLCDQWAVDAAFSEHQPELVIHTASTHGERADVVVATEAVAIAAKRHGARLIHISSDAVFDGSSSPYSESAIPEEPLDEYGRAKLEAELLVRALVPDASIVRTSLLVQVDPPDWRTQRVLDAMRNGEVLPLLVEEVRCPIAVAELADGLWRIVDLSEADAAGVWHVVGVEALSRYSLGVLVATAFGFDPRGLRGERHGDPTHPRASDVRLSIGRAESELGIRPSTMAEVLTRA